MFTIKKLKFKGIKCQLKAVIEVEESFMNY